MENENPVRVFQFNIESSMYDELEFDADVKLTDILDSQLILYFTEAAKYRSFIWVGSGVSTRMKFIAADSVTAIRNEIGAAIKINTVDEGDESHEFRVMMGLEEEKKVVYEQTGPSYQARIEDDDILNELTRDKIILILEKIPCPEGYQREFIIDGKNLYAYHEVYKQYMGEIIKERTLIPLEQKVPDGPYVAKDLTPRIIMNYNQVVLTELLKKKTDGDIKTEKKVEDKISSLNSAPAPFTL